jgi:hypothetical protein
MMSHTSLNWAAAAALSLTLLGCGQDGSKGHDPKHEVLDTVAGPAENGVMNVGGKLFSIPSPVQSALLIRKLGLPYEKNLPMDAALVDKMASKVQRSLALGAYGADLAYVTVHKDGQRALTTLQMVQKLSGQLGLSNAFDEHMVDGFKKGLNNEDSLLRFTGTAFRMADQYLKNNKRDDVSALVLAGGWIEGMYLTLSGTTEHTDATLTNRLGEQRKTLENLVKLVESTDQEHAHAALLAGLKATLAAYEGVNISYQYQPPTVDAAKKITYVNSTSTVTMTAEQFQAIAGNVKALRTLISA